MECIDIYAEELEINGLVKKIVWLPTIEIDEEKGITERIPKFSRPPLVVYQIGETPDEKAEREHKVMVEMRIKQEKIEKE